MYLCTQFILVKCGLAKSTRAKQLKAWRDSLTESGLTVKRTPANWIDAFNLLNELIVQSQDAKKVIFIGLPTVTYTTHIPYYG